MVHADYTFLWKDLSFAFGGPAGTAQIRSIPEDFQVVEQGMVTPSGEGEHCWLYIKKTNTNTQWVAKQLAKFAGVTNREVSYAGMKDRNAVTEQWFSVHLPGKQDPDWQQLNNEEYEVLEVHRHNRKLQRGTLKGNQFRLRLRNVTADTGLLKQRLEQLKTHGFPNYFGPQRFGRNGQNIVEASRWIQTPKRRIRRDQRSLYLSALRSALFNQVLTTRVNDQNWDQALAGDVLQLEGKSACFPVEILDQEIIERVQCNDIHPTGPLYGDGDPMVLAEVLALETQQLSPFNDWLEGLRSQRLKPARRALRVIPGDLNGAQQSDGDWLLSFSLPPGAYATCLLRELITVTES